MPHKRNKRKKRIRRSIKTGPLFWPLFIGNTFAGLLFSPITSATHINVSGAAASDQQRIEQELQWLKDKPCLSINNLSVEEQILKRPDVKSAVLSRNVFGRGHLTVSYYQPVAHIYGTDNVVLTEGGFLCQTPDVPDNIPMLELFDGCAHPSLGISTSWEPQKVADVCLKAAQEGIVNNLSVSVTVGGVVCLNSGVTGRVVLGSPDELDDKFQMLRTVLTQQPDLLTQGQELVLIAPFKPVTRAMPKGALDNIGVRPTVVAGEQADRIEGRG